MFNKTVVMHGRSETCFVTKEVNEHRAPTDESVKLLREMEEKAEEQVIASIKVGDTAFEAVVHIARDMLSDDIIFRAVFSLNGKKCDVTHRVPYYKYMGRDDAVRGLRDEMAKEIATRVLMSAMDDLNRWMEMERLRERTNAKSRSGQ